MHVWTHPADKHKGKSGQGDYNDIMVAHDENIGQMLGKLQKGRQPILMRDDAINH
jgi:hypothetical protein